VKLHIIILVLFLATQGIFAEFESSNNHADESKILTEKNAEILILKNRVKELEKELKEYKQVKPGIIDLISEKKLTSIKTNNIESKKYEVTTTAPEKVSAYFIAKYLTLNELKSKLKKNGFEILAIDEIYKDYVVITVTNEELKNTNSFTSALHISVNSGKEIRVQNPNYFGAAFLQEKYKYGIFNKTMTSLLEVFAGNMYTMKDKKKFSDLASYNFMLGMPNFDDVVTLYSDENILNKLDLNDSIDCISYRLELPNGSVLVGHKLKKETYNFFKKINAEDYVSMFPYEVMIEGNNAYMLHPKYYLPLSLPFVSMTDFMKIASAPLEIIKNIQQCYK